MAKELTQRMSVYQQDLPPDIAVDTQCHTDAKENLIEECEQIWTQAEKCLNRLTDLETETVPESKVHQFLQTSLVKALTSEYNQWQKRTPKILSTDVEVQKAAEDGELQKINKELEMVLSCVRTKQKKLQQELDRSQKMLMEQEQLLESLTVRQAEVKQEVVHFSEKRALQKLQIKTRKVIAYRKELLEALGDYLEEHYPSPEQLEPTKTKKKTLTKYSNTEMMTLHELLEVLINKMKQSPHDPYFTMDDSIWPPYTETLLRHGIILRHPEDPQRIRLEAFHQ